MSVAKMNAKAAELRATLPDGDTITASPKGRGKVTSGARRAGHGRGTIGSDGSTADVGQIANDYEVVRHRYEEVLKENETLKGEQKRRMESYMRRETSYQAEIEDLKAELERQGKERPPEDERMNAIRGQHGKVMDVLGAMQAREQLSLQEQEKDLLRAFRARLWDVQFELESERSKKDDGALEWIEKTKTLGKELDWSRDEALRLDRTNQFLMKENSRLKTQVRAQEDDREFMVRQMLTLKKENSRLKATKHEEDAGRADGEGDHCVSVRAQSASVHRGGPSSSSVDRPSTAGAAAFRGIDEMEMSGAGNGSLASSERIKELMLQQAESEERHREVVARLKRLLDVERRNLRAVRAAHAKDLQSRTELESLLRACVDDVRKEIAAQRGSGGVTKRTGAAGSPGRLVAVEELGPKERERVLELLLSQACRPCYLSARSVLIPRIPRRSLAHIDPRRSASSHCSTSALSRRTSLRLKGPSIWPMIDRLALTTTRNTMPRRTGPTLPLLVTPERSNLI